MGEIAALLTSLCWSFTSIQFTLAGQRIGPEVVNRARLVVAVVFLSIAHLLLQGQVWPIHAESYRWGWLGISAMIGLVLGDTCLFQSFILIGPRLAMLLLTLSPVIGALLAWVFLDETLQWLEIGAVLLTVSGIAWVIAERQANQDPSTTVEDDERQYGLGILLGVISAVSQALGLVLSKRGLEGDFSPLSATLMRMLVASLGIWLITLARGQAKSSFRALKDKTGRWFVIGGSLTGPFIGVWLSMVAVQNAHVGIASTLMSLPPILLIPLAYWVFKERASSRAIVGTLITLAGVAIIFLT